HLSSVVLLSSTGPTPFSTLPLPDALPISDLSTTGYVQFTIGRPAAGSGGGRVTFTATRSGRVPDVDAVDVPELPPTAVQVPPRADRKSTRLNSSHVKNSYAVLCLNKNATY